MKSKSFGAGAMFMKRALELEQCHFYDGSTAQETTRLFHKKLHE